MLNQHRLLLFGTFHHPAPPFSLNQGDWAWLKRLPDGRFSNISPKTSNVFELVGCTVSISMPVTDWHPDVLWKNA